jgi:hypothetical protein
MDRMNARGRTAFASLAIALGLLVGIAAASADTPLGHHGTVGSHHLRDTADSPGVHCQYESTNPNSPTLGALESLWVRPPVVYAVNATGGTDTQDVGWQFIVLRSTNLTTWTEVLRTSNHFKSATDSTPAAFGKRGTNFLGHSGTSYRVVVKMWWLNNGNGTVQGYAKNRVDFYAGGAFSGTSSCPGTIF